LDANHPPVRPVVALRDQRGELFAEVLARGSYAYTSLFDVASTRREHGSEKLDIRGDAPRDAPRRRKRVVVKPEGRRAM
jgi:hypothetical protein